MLFGREGRTSYRVPAENMSMRRETWLIEQR
jgi:hypothetical protein